MSNNNYSVNSQVFTYTLVGNKPYTQYTVYSDGYDLSCRVKPWGKNIGEPLISDASGKLNFMLFYLDMPEKVGLVNNFPSINNKTTDVQSDKIIWIVDPSGTAIKQITIPFSGTNPNMAYNLTKN